MAKRQSEEHSSEDSRFCSEIALLAECVPLPNLVIHNLLLSGNKIIISRRKMKQNRPEIAFYVAIESTLFLLYILQYRGTQIERYRTSNRPNTAPYTI